MNDKKGKQYSSNHLERFDREGLYQCLLGNLLIHINKYLKIKKSDLTKEELESMINQNGLKLEIVNE